jgi:hypothetical protein
MPRLVKNDGNRVHVAHRYVASPSYTLVVADCDENTVLPDGWTFYAEDVAASDFAQPWVQPRGAHDAYALGATVLRAGITWRSVVAANVWEPGVFGWVDESTVVDTTPTWVQPTGAHDSFSKGAVVKFNGETWTSTLDANVWAPGVIGWAKKLTPPAVAPSDPPAWVQPTGAQDAYALGATVTHNGSVWVSVQAANVWEPGVFGWNAT